VLKLTPSCDNERKKWREGASSVWTKVVGQLITKKVFRIEKEPFVEGL